MSFLFTLFKSYHNFIQSFASFLINTSNSLILIEDCFPYFALRIPYIATKCRTPQNVFLLPCCPFDFNGSKYQRTSANLSQYTCYLRYLETVCNTFGFDVKTDKLRIPSTKRICLICCHKSYDKNTEIDVKKRSKRLVEKKLNNLIDYKPRDRVEAVRNCTRLPKDVINSIVNIIANEIIKGNTEMTISSIPDLLTDDMKRHLKSQCGGLQTLLRNHKNIFEGIQHFLIIDGSFHDFI